MEAKLRSISNQIPWSLLLKAVLFGAGWFTLPFWLFIVFSLYLYLVPLFQPYKLATPFLLTLILSGFLESNPWIAVFLSVVFFFILGIKDLLFVDRQTAYSLLVFVLSFLFILFSYSKMDSGVGFGSFFWVSGIGIALTLLFKSFLKYVYTIETRRRNTFLGLFFLAFIEISLAVLFLPANFFHQTAISFLSFTILFEAMSDYFAEKLNSKRALVYFSLFFGVISIILASAGFSI